MTTSGNQGSDIENDDQEKAGKPSYRQSAEVCDNRTNQSGKISSTEAEVQLQEGSERNEKPTGAIYTAASQRIYAKEL